MCWADFGHMAKVAGQCECECECVCLFALFAMRVVPVFTGMVNKGRTLCRLTLLFCFVLFCFALLCFALLCFAFQADSTQGKETKSSPNKQHSTIACAPCPAGHCFPWWWFWRAPWRPCEKQRSAAFIPIRAVLGRARFSVRRCLGARFHKLGAAGVAGCSSCPLVPELETYQECSRRQMQSLVG